MFAGLSSTTRMRGTLRGPRTHGHRAPDLHAEAGALERRLTHDARDVTVEPVAVRGGDLLRREDDNRDARRLRMPVERLHDIEAADVRHHQVEDDEVGQLLI